MKNFKFAALLVIAALFVSCGMFKKRSNNSKQITHMVESKSLVGVWQQSGASIENVKYAPLMITGNYKMINTDNTFFTLKGYGTKFSCSFYGTYQMTSDSTYTEKIIKHNLNPSMSGSESKLRFNLIDENTMALEYFDTLYKRWVPEIWVRVQLKGPAPARYLGGSEHR
jgi:hypothetical protein